MNIDRELWWKKETKRMEKRLSVACKEELIQKSVNDLKKEQECVGIKMIENIK